MSHNFGNSNIDDILSNIDNYIAYLESGVDVSSELDKIESYADSIETQYNMQLNDPKLISSEAQIKKVQGATSTDQLLDEELMRYVVTSQPKYAEQIKKTIADSLEEEAMAYSKAIDAVIEERNADYTTKTLMIEDNVGYARKIIPIIEKLSLIVVKLDKSGASASGAPGITIDVVGTKINGAYPTKKPKYDDADKKDLSFDLNNLNEYLKLLNLSAAANVDATPYNGEYILKNKVVGDSVLSLSEKAAKYSAQIEDYVKKYYNRILKQTGGAPIDDVKKAILLPLRIEKTLLKLKEERKLLLDQQKANNANLAKLAQVQTPQATKKNLKDDFEYFKPVLALLNYNLGNINQIDHELLNYLATLGLPENVIFAIYLAQRKEDVYYLIATNYPQYTPAVVNILRLKKMSAFHKFKMNYGVMSEQELIDLKHRGVYFR